MEWIEWLLSREFRQFILDNNLFFPLLFVWRAVGIPTSGSEPVRIATGKYRCVDSVSSLSIEDFSFAGCL